MCLGDCEKPGNTVGARKRIVRHQGRLWEPGGRLKEAGEAARGME